MLTLLTIASAFFFVSHVILLFTSFPGGKFLQTRYFWSHATLWATGLSIFLLALLFQGSGKSDFLDYFGTPVQKAMILVVTALVSILAHTIVSRLILAKRHA